METIGRALDIPLNDGTINHICPQRAVEHRRDQQETATQGRYCR